VLPAPCHSVNLLLSRGRLFAAATCFRYSPKPKPLSARERRPSHPTLQAVEAQQQRVDTIETFMKEHDALHDLLADLPNKTSHQLMVRSSPQRP
jgi:hypothetical protein